MTNIQKAGFFIMAGILMLAGTAGGVEVSPDLLSYDGLYLLAFFLVGMAFMAIGVSYAKEVDA